jgi:nucleoside-specific outer membrane channel protein Tsx
MTNLTTGPVYTKLCINYYGDKEESQQSSEEYRIMGEFQLPMLKNKDNREISINCYGRFKRIAEPKISFPRL